MTDEANTARPSNERLPGRGSDPVRMRIRPDPTQLIRTRSRVRDYLWTLPIVLTEAMVQDAVLVVDELLTNALKHGVPPIELRLAHDATHLLIEVDDGSVSPAAPRHADTHGGRGLRLIEGLTSSWGQRSQTHGKTVWAQLPIAVA